MDKGQEAGPAVTGYQEMDAKPLFVDK